MEPMQIVASVNILDRGDGPAQEVLDRTARNRAQRKQDETRDELNKITDRVGKALDHFEISTAEPEASVPTTEYVEDLDDLTAILNDSIKKRKYQQKVTIFVVGYQNTCTNRLKIMQQVNEFFNDTTNRWDEEELSPKSPEFDIDEVQQSVTESLETAQSLTGRISELNKEMVDYMYQYANAKFGNKNRKKLEKALTQAKEDVEVISEKLLGVQKELEEKDEKIQNMFKQIELKTMEAQRYKTAAEVAKKSMQETNANSDALDAKEREIRELNKKIDSLSLELAQKESSRENTQKELLTSGRENILKIKELEDKLGVIAAEHQASVRDLNDYHDRQITNLSNMHRQEMKDAKDGYEAETQKLKLFADKQGVESRYLKTHLEEIEVLHQTAAKEVAELQAKFDSMVEKENGLVSERDALSKQLSDYTKTQSVRTSSASSSVMSDTLRSDLDAASKVAGKSRKVVQKPPVKGGETSVKDSRRGGKKKKQTESVKSVSVLEDVEPPKLEPEPAIVQLPEDFNNEAKWETYPMQQSQSAFAQYRTFTQEKVGELEARMNGIEGRAAKKVASLKSQFNEHKSRWHTERSLLVSQIELAQRMMGDAEKDADNAINQLESFVNEAEHLEHEEQTAALTRQTNTLTAKQADLQPETPEPAAVSVESADDLLLQTDDAKSLKAASGSPGVLMQVTSAKGTVDHTSLVNPESPHVENWDPRLGSRVSQTSHDELAHIRSRAASMHSKPMSQRSAKFSASKPADTLTSLKSLMNETSLDVVQNKALVSLRNAMTSGDGVESSPNAEIHQGSLTVFGLALQFSAESLGYGYKPEGFFQTIINLYGKAADELQSTLTSDPNISDLTKMIVADISQPAAIDKSPSKLERHSTTLSLESNVSVPGPSLGTPALPEEDFHTPSVPGATPCTPGLLPSREASASSGRSTPHSRLSSKYRASVSSARQSLVERRSTSPAIIVPDRASFHDAELDENANTEEDISHHHRSTSVGSSLNAVSMIDKSTAVSAKTQATASRAASATHSQLGTADHSQPHSANRRTETPMAASDGAESERYASSKTVRSEASLQYSERPTTEPPVALADAGTSVTPVRKPSAYDMTTSVTPKQLADRPTSYSAHQSRSGSQVEHPAVEEYVALYKAVVVFKNRLTSILSDKDMMSSSQVLADLEIRELNEDLPMLPQIEMVSSHCRRVLDDCCDVITDALNSAFRDDYNVSSLVSREASYLRDLHSRPNSTNEVPPATPQSQKRSARSVVGRTPSVAGSIGAVDTTNFTNLQESFNKLQTDFEKEVKNHQDDVTHNTVLVMELQDTVHQLRMEIEQLKEQSKNQAAPTDVDSAIMFTRLDAERNAKNLKRAIANSRLPEEKYQTAVDKMEEYISLPAKRLSELVKKYVHHVNMQRIEDVIRNRGNIQDSEMQMLERMETLQNMRTQRWIEKMDSLGERRAELASDLMETLEELEQESGIFMIKPMYSYSGLRKHLNIKPAPAAAVAKDDRYLKEHKIKAAETSKREAEVQKQNSRVAWMQENQPTVFGNSWNMETSVPSDDLLDNTFVNTPKLLELDVARTMYSQNQVSMKTNPYLNPTNTRSYITIGGASGIRRPASSENLMTKSTGSLPTVRRSGSAHDAYQLAKSPSPLPPIQRSNTVQSEIVGDVNDENTPTKSPVLARDFTGDSTPPLPTHITRVIAQPRVS